MKNIAIFASGNGSNAACIAKYFDQKSGIRVAVILTNNPDAGVLDRAKELNIPTHIFSRKSFYETDEVIRLLEQYQTDLVVLAGFLWLVPDNILRKYNNRVVNIHPALLPKFGGKGMYGHRVHRAVIESGDKRSGITIHFVNARYDEGQVILQKELDVLQGETPEQLASRIHELEYEFFPKTIEKVIERL